MYAPVTEFAIALRAGSAVGYAAPAAGAWPAGIELWGDERLVATARATRFSDDALGLGVRHGWCGYVVEGAGEALAIAGHATLRCAASGAVLAEPTVQDLSSSRPAWRRLTVEAALAHVRDNDCAATIEQIMPFALAFRARVGPGDFLVETVTMLLRRPVGFEEALKLLHLRGDEAPPVILKRVTALREFADNAIRFIPGPFHPEFRFGRHAF